MPDITKGHTFSDGESVTHTKLNNIVDSATINDAVIGADQLASDAVETAKIADNAVTDAKLADTAVTAAAYTTADITVDAQGRITAASTGVPAAASITSSMLASGAAIPTGSIMQYAGSSAPTDWLLCDDSSDELNTYTYRVLHAVISNTYGGTAYSEGVTDQSGVSTTFAAPDLRGRVAIGVGTGNTAQGGGAGTARVLAATGGAETHTLTEAQLAAHGHNIDFTGRNASGHDGGGRVVSGDSGTEAITAFDTDDAGSGTAHENMTPFLVVNYIIKI